jgi:hypothetical protein
MSLAPQCRCTWPNTEQSWHLYYHSHEQMSLSDECQAVKELAVENSIIASTTDMGTVRYFGLCMSTMQMSDMLSRMTCIAGCLKQHTTKPTTFGSHFPLLFMVQCVQKVTVHLGYGMYIWLNGFRPVSTLMDITSNTFRKCTATFRTHCTTKMHHTSVRQSVDKIAA